MINVENIEVWGFVHAIRGMRNPMNSWDKSDSEYIEYEDWKKADTGETWEYVIGPNDLDLMRRLCKAGPEHRKYLRQIFVSMDITAPLYWWKEMDQYRIGVTTNSCSTMHKIHDKKFEFNDFSTEHLYVESMYALSYTITVLNEARELYIESKRKEDWWQMIQLLPSSYNQRRTITMSYENVVNIISQRSGHKLDEWNLFVEELKRLPYIKEIMDEH